MLLARIFIPALILYFIPGCINNGNENRERDLRNEVQKSTIAEKFSIEKKDGYSILTIINPWQGASNVLHKWYLVKKGSPVPQGIDGKDVIPVPVRSIICMSTTYIPMIKALGREGTIKGISGTSLIYDDSVRTMVNSGEIADVGYEDNLNKELLIKISPELLITYGVGSEASGYMNKVRDLGIKVMFNADYLETDPLAKAEWIKVFGALYGCEKEADDIFSDIQKRYLELMVFVRENIKNRPKVLLGYPWKDTWFISPGNSFSCKLLSDAGGDYLWKDTRSEVSMPLGVENVWYKALRADFWINPGTASSIDEILALDNRLGELPCVEKGNIFNNNNRVRTDVGNDYWESGSLNPDVILKDLASIFHPELFPGYVPVYYKKLKRQ
jgi:iron complex transport system substrate-binding protein